MSRTRDAVSRAVRAGIAGDTAFGAVIPPVVLSSNFSYAGLGQPRTHAYTRSGNPTRDELVRALADLEGAAGGVVTASGLAAVLVAIHATGAHRILASSDGYGGTFRLLTSLAARGSLEVEWVDAWRSDALASAVARVRPDLVWLETPSNPLLRITDLTAAVAAARRHDARIAVDNTFLSPARQRPLDFGADLVVHSTTKYLNGHSDVVGGAVLAGDDALAEQVVFWGNCLGVTGSPFDSFLTLRGLRTLHARLAVHEANAAEVARFLETHPAVERVYWPGLESHPGHDVACRQQSGFGGVVSFVIAGRLPAARQFVASLECFTLAESLGGVESLVTHPTTMTHAPLTPEARLRAGISDGLLRLSLGIESARDLVADLEQALAQATPTHRAVREEAVQ